MREAEKERLAALLGYSVLDTPSEARFDRLTEFAADLFDAPIALVSLIDAERQFFKARVGLAAQETLRSWSFCNYAIECQRGDVFVVLDAAADPRFAANPLVVGEPRIRFYAGAVLTDEAGHNLGTLCIIDTKARAYPSARELDQLKRLAELVMDELALTRANHERKNLLAAAVIARNEAEGHARRALLAERTARLGHWRLEVATSAVQWSPMMHEIYGLPTDAPLDLTALMGMTHPDDQHASSENLKRALALGEPFESHEVRIMRADGELRHLRGGCAIEKAPDGTVTAVTGVLLDVTDQKRARLLLAESEARYRLMAENTADMIVTSTLDGEITFVSNACLALGGYTPAELIGANALALAHPDDAPLIRRAFGGLLNGAQSQCVRWRAAHKTSGEYVWVESNPRLLRNATTQAPEGFLDVARDISAQRAQEQALALARADAERATAVKAEFLANMSHELRTPLTSILGFGRMISGEPDLGKKTRHYADRILTASKSLLALVNDLLDLSKIEAGQIKIERGPASPTAIASEVLEMFELHASEKYLALTFVPSPDVPAFVTIDSARTRQILLNLVSNAVKFTERGGITVSLKYEHSRLRFIVSDTGPGIDENRRGQLFQRFSQIESHRAFTHNGAGLGLAICRGIVDAMGGEIGVDSAPGGGASFWFETPAPIAASPSSDQSARSLSPGKTLEDVRVLIADDHAPTRELVQCALGALGARVQQANDGVQAVEWAANAPFDVILLDMRMPDRLTGSEAAKMIRTPGALNAETPILAFSADSQGLAQSSMQADGFDGRIEKPIDLPLLIEAILQWTSSAPTHSMTEERNVA